MELFLKLGIVVAKTTLPVKLTSLYFMSGETNVSDSVSIDPNALIIPLVKSDDYTGLSVSSISR